MTIPRIQPQTTLAPPPGIKLDISVLWTRRADHCVVRYEVRAGMAGELLALGIGSGPDMREPEALSNALNAMVVDLVGSLERSYVNPEPF